MQTEEGLTLHALVSRLAQVAAAVITQTVGPVDAGGIRTTGLWIKTQTKHGSGTYQGCILVGICILVYACVCLCVCVSECVCVCVCV